MPRPEIVPGSALLETIYSEVCGTDVHLWHGRLSGVPYPIIPGHVSVGRLAEANGPLVGIDGTRLREGDPVVFFDVHRTCGRCYACTVARTPTRCPSRRVYGITDPAAEGLLGGWAQAIYLEPGVAVAEAARRRLAGGLHRRRLRPAHRGARHRAGRRPARRAGARPGRRRRRPEHRRPGPHRRRALGRRRRRSRRSPRAGNRDGGRRRLCLDGAAPRNGGASVLAATDGRGPDIVIEAAGSARAVEEGLDIVRDGGVYVIAGHYTDVGAEHDQRASPHQPQAPRRARLLGQRGAPLRHRARSAAAARGHGAVGAHRRDVVRVGRAERGLAPGGSAGLHQGAGGAERGRRAGLTRRPRRCPIVGSDVPRTHRNGPLAESAARR